MAKSPIRPSPSQLMAQSAHQALGFGPLSSTFGGRRLLVRFLWLVLTGRGEAIGTLTGWRPGDGCGDPGALFGYAIPLGGGEVVEDGVGGAGVAR
jgi:hypothetical protein